MASPTTNKGYTYAAHGGSVGAWDTQLNGNFEYQDLNLGGYYAITASSSITVANTFNSTYATIASTARSVTIPTSIAQNLFYNVLGTLQSSLAINMPAAGSIYVFGNGITTNSSNELVVGPTGGSTITLPSGGRTIAVLNSSAAYYAQNTFDPTADAIIKSVTASSSISAQSVTASSAISGQSVAASSAISGQSVAASSAISGQSLSISSAATITGALTVSSSLGAIAVNTLKAFGSFTVSGGVVGFSSSSAFNVASVSRTATGSFTITYSSAIGNANYTITFVGDGVVLMFGTSNFTKRSSNVSLKTAIPENDTAARDPTYCNFAVFGI